MSLPIAKIKNVNHCCTKLGKKFILTFFHNFLPPYFYFLPLKQKKNEIIFKVYAVMISNPIPSVSKLETSKGVSKNVG